MCTVRGGPGAELDGPKIKQLKPCQQIRAGNLTLRLCFNDPLILISIAGMTAKVRL